jgi:hypothetical protein
MKDQHHGQAATDFLHHHDKLAVEHRTTAEAGRTFAAEP